MFVYIRYSTMEQLDVSSQTYLPRYTQMRQLSLLPLMSGNNESNGCYINQVPTIPSAS